QVRARMQQELLEKRRAELAKKIPAGQPLPDLPAPEIARQSIPVQPAEQKARAHYEAILSTFGDQPLANHVRLELAELHAQRGELDQAITRLREALDQEPLPELAERVRLRLGDWL